MNTSHPLRRYGSHRWRCLVVGFVALGLVVPSVAAQDVVHITGTVRDFMKSHPDFNVAAGTGHVANNVALTAADNRPSLVGSGFAVATQWRNKDEVNIPPHHFYNGAVMLLGSAPDYNASKSYIDSWNSADGPYGGSNVGPAPPVVVGPLPPVPPPPTGLPMGSADYAKGSVNTVSNSFQTSSFTTGQNTTVNIAPDTTVTIYVTGSVTVGQNSSINVPDGSKLILYFEGNFNIHQGGMINMTAPLDPSRCVIYNLGSNTITFSQNGKICAQIHSPDGHVHLDRNDEFFGTIIAKGLSMDQYAAVHFDGMPKDMCGEPLADLAGAPGGASAGAISSPNSFNQWFTNVLGVNAAVAHTITLTKNSSGVFEFSDNAFFPIDNMVFGNEGDDHNFNFTFTFSASFVFDGCSELFFEFQGSDDAWVYIDGKLALDLGGVMPLVPQRAELDRLELIPGETYTLHFFFAQRNPFMSVMNIKTNLPLEPSHVPTMTALYD